MVVWLVGFGEVTFWVVPYDGLGLTGRLKALSLELSDPIMAG